MTELDQKWNMQLEQLVEFKRKNGHCRVPCLYDQDMPLGQWVHTQRKLHNNNTIRQDRKTILDGIGFAWKADGDKLWHDKYEKLVEFKRKNGHCMVPHRYEQDESLGNWVGYQRSRNCQQYRKDLLDEIGFAWKGEGVRKTTYNDKIWHQKYERLVQFKRKHGHCRVPSIYEQDKSLGQWVSNQRSIHTIASMRQDRKDLLDEIGFAWENSEEAHSYKPDDKLWHRQFEKLIKFKQKNGHCMVPSIYEQDKSLGPWVSTQRNYHNYNKLRRDREELLDGIDFAWKAERNYHNNNKLRRDREELLDGIDAQGHVGNRFECPSPNRKRTSARLAESGKRGARTNRRGNATGSGSSVMEDGGNGNEEDPKPTLVTSGPLGACPVQEEVQEEPTRRDQIPSGWARVKLEPDC
jgi:uncharacterized protein YbgA (DUF1722 family)